MKAKLAETRQSVAFAILGIASALLIVWFRYWLNPRFFFIDDAQAQFYPGIHEIARLIEAGHPPWVSLRSWFSGNIAGDYIYGIFNPVALLTIAAVGGNNDLALAAAVFVSVNVAISALGGFFLARHFNARPAYACLVAFAVGSNNYLIYWYGASWVAGLVGFSWSIWAACFVLKAAIHGKYIFIASIAVYLLLTAGYPGSIVGLAIFVACYLATDLWWSQWCWTKVLRVSVAGFCGILMAMPALIPVWAQLSVSTRAETISSGIFDNFLSADVPGLISFAFPSFLPVMRTWGPMFSGKFGVVEMPFYYAGWFPLLALTYLDWHAAWHKSRMTLFALALTTIVLMLVSLMPSLPLFRWSFKFIPYYSLALALLGAYILSNDQLLKITPTRTAVLLFITALLTAWATFYSSAYWHIHLLFFALMSAAAIGFYVLRVRAVAFAPLHVMIVSVLLTALTCVFWSENSELPDAGALNKVSDITFLGSQGQNLTVFNATEVFCCDPVQRKDFAHGNIGYLSDNNFVNGYATIQPARLWKELCVGSAWGTVCEDVGERLLSVDRMTGSTLADLIGIDVIVAQEGPIADNFEQLAGLDWEVYRDSPYGRAYKKKNRADVKNGTVSWVPPGIQISSTKQDHLHETIEITVNESYQGEPLIFERAWHPGYEASFGGETIPVDAYRGFLVAINLPDAEAKEVQLELNYRLPGMPWTLIVAFLGLMLAAVASVFLPRYLKDSSAPE